MSGSPATPGAQAASALELALARSPTLGAGRLIAIDGPSGSGKSSIAKAIVAGGAAYSTALIAMDDLYAGWGGLDAALAPRVVGQLLTPLAAGRPARWQRYDWEAGRFGDWVETTPTDLLVIEGCGSGARLLAPWTTLLVWMEAPPDVRKARAVARDGPSLLPHWEAWTRSEKRHFTLEQTRLRADLRMTT